MLANSASNSVSTSMNSSETSETPLKIWSCTTCRRRKVRCDRRHPCAPCIRSSEECVFPVSGRIPRRSRLTAAAQQERSTLLGRLRRLEAMVGELGEQVEQASTSESASEDQGALSFQGLVAAAVHSDVSMPKPDIVTKISNPEEELDLPKSMETFGKMIEDRGDGELIVKDRFWTVFCKEVEHIFDAVHGSLDAFHRDEIRGASPGAGAAGGSRQYTSYYNFLLRNTSLAARKNEELYPLPSQIPFLWQVYVDNVDPFIKVLHVPTVARVVREFKGSYQSLTPSLRALVLAISLAAVMSLDDEKVKLNFNKGRQELLAQYRKATEQALEDTNVAYSPELTGLQAFTIYLGVLQQTGDGRTAWVVAGVLVRAAASLGLHRDGSHFAHLTPLEQELRRRLWWQICLVDSRSENVKNVGSLKIGEDSFDTQMPAKIDDTELEPGNASGRAGKWTDTTVALLQCEIWKFSRALQSVNLSAPDAQHQRLQLLEETQSRIETQYFQHLDPLNPLHSFVAAFGRLFLVKVSLILNTQTQAQRHQVQPPQPLPNRAEFVFLSAVAVLEYTYSLQNNPEWQGWRWQIHAQQPPWQALRTVLGHLHGVPSWISEHERAWSISLSYLQGLPAQDEKARPILALAAAVQQERAELFQQRSLETDPSSSPHFNSASEDQSTQSPTSAPSLQFGLSGIPEPVFDTEHDKHLLDELPSSQMDWQNWNDMAEIFGPSWEQWEFNGL